VKENKKLRLILGSHAHVPCGASDREFEYVYENKMRPFVSNLYRYSNIQAVLHYSGVLLYWVERNHPEFFMLIEDMVNRKQAEILGGGFYEPMFPLIPLQDRIGQIELMTTYLRKQFGKRPLGCWIPSLAWEQHLAAALAASDMSYTFLSQEQFLKAGLSAHELFYPCISEDQGKLVTIFPLSFSTADALAEKSCSQVFIELSGSLAESGGIIAVFPEKAASSAQEAQDTAWHRFFEELSLSKETVETVLPGRIFKTLVIKKKGTFPNSSSLENDFSPRRFLIDTWEANGIYSKMIFTNVLINQLKGDKSRKQNAREELWKAQDSSLFVPGSGQHRHELRKAAYSSLLRAELLSREKGRFIPSLIKHDFDLDGKEEYLFQDMWINCYVHLKGAVVFELDYLPKEWNYLDCGSYASNLGGDNKKEGGGSRRASFADAILPPQTVIEEPDNAFPEGSRLLFNEQFEEVSQDRKGKSCFKSKAESEDAQNIFYSIEVNKCYQLKKDVLITSYSFKNSGNAPVDFCFFTEINFSFAGSGEEYVRFYALDGGKEITAERTLTDIEALKILDIKNEVQMLLSSSKTFSGFLLPACTNGLYQSDRALAHFPVSIEAGGTWTNEISIKFSH